MHVLQPRGLGVTLLSEAAPIVPTTYRCAITPLAVSERLRGVELTPAAPFALPCLVQCAGDMDEICFFLLRGACGPVGALVVYPTGRYFLPGTRNMHPPMEIVRAGAFGMRLLIVIGVSFGEGPPNSVEPARRRALWPSGSKFAVRASACLDFIDAAGSGSTLSLRTTCFLMLIETVSGYACANGRWRDR